ncbi:hypothetical protein PHAVU_002G195800 [Phaseolus vulgaris]|uniref:Uncharacterized protein n=1 Tax=Phaseolus vulgaris TaxID=3885 RepID=V7CLC3_PHAVU|nr:hypothetical protein PHAVU_002G195800g [Phaseolus vulgaris]ESW30949.1 hypothetical protein PHAVU_002G195800g [Phaseolus vulgaris]
MVNHSNLAPVLNLAFPKSCFPEPELLKALLVPLLPLEGAHLPLPTCTPVLNSPSLKSCPPPELLKASSVPLLPFQPNSDPKKPDMVEEIKDLFTLFHWFIFLLALTFATNPTLIL